MKSGTPPKKPAIVNGLAGIVRALVRASGSKSMLDLHPSMSQKISDDDRSYQKARLCHAMEEILDHYFSEEKCSKDSVDTANNIKMLLNTSWRRQVESMDDASLLKQNDTILKKQGELLHVSGLAQEVLLQHKRLESKFKQKDDKAAFFEAEDVLVDAIQQYQTTQNSKAFDAEFNDGVASKLKRFK